MVKEVNMQIISFDEIFNLNIPIKTCIEWAEEVIRIKNTCILPAKNSIHFGKDNNSFFNTMPSFIPFLHKFGVKEVSRLPDRIPALKADILLYDTDSGDLLSCMDGTWITTMRTGAVAAITINKLKTNNTKNFSFIGLGNTARSTLLCLNEILNYQTINVNLFEYKDQHELFIQRFQKYENIHFSLYKDVRKMINNSDVVVSCVTAANSYFAEPTDFKKGCLVVPIHTKGFQNCDLQFDKIFCDDIDHIKGFKYFNEYKYVKEMTDVLNDPIFERSPEDRILAYNIGISLQDIYFAAKIYELFLLKQKHLNKFWV